MQQGSDVWLRARWYGAGRGSFGSRDPYVGDVQTPYSMQYYQYGYSAPTRWTDPSGAVVRDPLREPTTCPPGMFATCYEEYLHSPQYDHLGALHPSLDADNLFFDAYAAEALTAPSLNTTHIFWKMAHGSRSQTTNEWITTGIAALQTTFQECGPAAGIAGIAEGANELNKNLAGANRAPSRLGMQQGSNETAGQSSILPKSQKIYNGRVFTTFDGRTISDDAVDASNRARSLADDLRRFVPGRANAEVTVAVGIKDGQYYVTAYRPRNPKLWETIKGFLEKTDGYTWVDNPNIGPMQDAHGERVLDRNGFTTIGISNTGGPCRGGPNPCYPYFEQRPNIHFAWPSEKTPGP